MADDSKLPDQAPKIMLADDASEAAAHSSLQQDALGLTDEPGGIADETVTALSVEAWQDNACGPQDQPPPDFSGAQAADNAAKKGWAYISSNNGFDLSNANPNKEAMRKFLSKVHEYRNWAGTSAKERLKVLDLALASNDVDKLRTLSRRDPDRLEKSAQPGRAVPVASPIPADKPVYLNEDMQRCLLAYLTIINPGPTVTIGRQKNVQLVDIELAYQAGAKLDDQTARILHSNARDNLKEICKQPYNNMNDAAKQKLATRLGLSVDEVGTLYKRLDDANDQLARLS